MRGLFVTCTLLAMLLAATHAQEKYPPLPGLDEIGIGFDIVYGAPKGLPVVDFDAPSANSSVWSNPFYNLTYSYPSQINVVDRPSFGVEAYVFRSAGLYAQWKAHECGLRMPPIGVFSLNSQVQSSASIFGDNKNIMAYTRQQTTIYGVAVKPNFMLNLNAQFLDALNSLPLTYDEKAYTDFFSYYGTHWIREAVYGGQAVATMSVTAAFANDTSDLVVTANARARFHKLKSGFGGSISRNSSAQFVENAVVLDSTLEGGNPVYQGNLSEWRKWVVSVKDDPVQVRRRIESLAKLIPGDDKVSAQRRAVLDYATLMYIHAHNATDKPVPTAPMRLGQCECYDENGHECAEPLFVNGYPRVGHDNCPYTPHHCCRPCISLIDALAPPPPVLPPTPPSSILTDNVGRRTIPVNDQPQLAELPTIATSQCGALPCLPSLDTLGLGYDIVRGTPTNQQIIDWTFNNGNTYTNPFNKKQVFAVPDQAVVINSPSSPVNTELFTSASEYSQWKAHSCGLDFTLGMFAFDLDIQQSFGTFQRNQGILGILTEEISYFQTSLFPQVNATSAFVEYVSRLPKQFDPVAYAHFLQVFGTHYLKSTNTGGKVVMTAIVDQDFYASHSNGDILAQLKTQLAVFKAGFDSGHGQDYATFSQQSFAEVYFEGGDYAQLNISDFDAWVLTIQRDPSEVTYSLSPVSDLISDPVKKANVDRALHDYLNITAMETHANLLEEVSRLNLTWTPPPTNGTVERDHDNCDTDFWTSGFDATHDGDYVSYPMKCRKSWFVDAVNDTYWKSLSWCDCFTGMMGHDSLFCETGFFIRGFDNHYGGVEGDYPQPPVQCCRACLTPV